MARDRVGVWVASGSFADWGVNSATMGLVNRAS